MFLGLGKRGRLEKQVKESAAAVSSGNCPAAVAALAQALRLADESGRAEDQASVDAAGEALMVALRQSPAALSDLLPDVVDAALQVHATDRAARWVLSAESELRGLVGVEAPARIGYVIHALQQTMSASTKLRLRPGGARPSVVAGSDKIAIARLAVDLLDAVSPDDVGLPALLAQHASFLLREGRARDALPIARRACEVAGSVLDASDPLVPRLHRKLAEVEDAIAPGRGSSGADALFLPKSALP